MKDFKYAQTEFVKFDAYSTGKTTTFGDYNTIKEKS